MQLKGMPLDLIPINPDKLNNLEKIPQGHFLFINERFLREQSLQIFGYPTKINPLKKDSFAINPQGLKNLGWSVDTLHPEYPVQLVMLKLQDTQKQNYGVYCDPISSFSRIEVKYNNSYLIQDSKESLSEIFDFGATKLLNLGNFADKEIQKLSDFLYRDFTTQKYTNKCNEIKLALPRVQPSYCWCGGS
ncbi:MAG: hypothetical protein KJ646_00830 [Nanoarchaeota archaeon]|nr:hypothetical protein [Nanoarchaeota archaeon]MBU4116479.1 hypothetical protein [Nanoarchaeota archaeon]